MEVFSRFLIFNDVWPCGTVLVRVLRARNLQNLRVCVQNLASREKYSGSRTFLVSALNLKPLTSSSCRSFPSVPPDDPLFPFSCARVVKINKITALLVEHCLEREDFVLWNYSISDKQIS